MPKTCPKTKKATVLAAVAGVLVSLLVPLVHTGRAWAALPSTLDLSGHGWGHGEGMGQWGADGYALDGWTYQQILAHYYGGTDLSPDPDAAPNGIEVDISELSGAGTVWVTAPSGLVVDGSATAGTCYALTSGHTARAAGTDNDITVWSKSGCSSGWDRSYKGTIKVSSGQVVDTVDLTDYVEGVVPFESLASWPAAALEAQAVAARSYALADTDNGARAICDTTACQVYGGDPVESGVVGSYYGALSNRAVTDTIASSGQPLVLYCGSDSACGSSDAVALTEYSASTGGYTAGGAFPAVADAGDSVAPEHDWTATLTLARIASAFPALGTIQSVQVTQRNGLGDMGGRVLELSLSGSRSSESVTGEYFASLLGLDSDWFEFTNIGSTPSTPASKTSTSTSTSASTATVVAMVRTSNNGGYWLLDSAGDIYSYGNAISHGDKPGIAAVGLARTYNNEGYWVAAANGKVYAFGRAHDYGSVRGTPAGGRVVGIVATAKSLGYWLVTASGGVYTFGNAGFYGSENRKAIAGTMVGMAVTPDEKGYWLVSSGGGVYAFGDASGYGSLTKTKTVGSTMGITDIPSGKGYRVSESGGGVYIFGAARWYGSMQGKTTAGSVVGLVPTSSGGGYWLFSSGGGVYAFGDARFHGDRVG